MTQLFIICNLYVNHSENKIKTVKGVGDGSGLSRWKNYFELGSGVEARTRPDILRVVLGPYVQYCPCEASEQKWGKNQK